MNTLTSGSQTVFKQKIRLIEEPTIPKTSLFQLALIILFAIFIKILQPIAIANSKNSDGKYNYNESTMVLLVEFVKLVFCGAVFLIQLRSASPDDKDALHDLSFTQSLHFLVPSILYAASNTLVYYGLSYINPALFHVFGNIRILTAGFMYRIMVGKKQTDIQWLSLFLIACGALLSAPAPDKSNPNENYMLGLFLLVLMTLCSTGASIYTEKYYKKTQNLSIFYQNSVLYLYGILINFIVVLFVTSNNDKEIFAGFDKNGLIVLIVQSTMGISLSFIFKYLDNIVYVISLVVSMFITAVISSIFYDFKVSLSFVCALLVVTIAIYLFYRPKILEKYKIDETNFLI